MDPCATVHRPDACAVCVSAQVCLLGCGAIIGDMSVRESAGGPPRRSATVVALTELVTFKVPLKEFVRRMPADVLEVSEGVPGALAALAGWGAGLGAAAFNSLQLQERTNQLSRRTTPSF